MYPVQRQRPSGVTILAILYAIQGIAWIAGGGIAAWALSVFAVFPGFDFALLGAICLGVGAILAIFYFIIAWGLWTMQSWARWVAIIFAIISLFSVPIGTIIGIIILLYLFQPEVKAAFGEAPPPVYGAPYVPYAPPGYPPQYPQQPGYPPQQPGYPPQQPAYQPPAYTPPAAQPPPAAAAPPSGGKCRNCGASLTPGVAFCPNCGSRVT